jgi:hypothetical protein
MRAKVEADGNGAHEAAAAAYWETHRTTLDATLAAARNGA